MFYKTGELCESLVVLVAVIPDPRAARSLLLTLLSKRFARTVDGYHPSKLCNSLPNRDSRIVNSRIYFLLGRIAIFMISNLEPICHQY